MNDVINLLHNVLSTMDTISVTGIGNQDKFVGCANAIRTTVSRLEQFAAQEHEKAVAVAKEDTPDG